MSDEWEIRPLTFQERLSLAPHRAQAWAPPLTTEQFTQRNEVLYSSEFGQSRVRSLGLFIPGSETPVASCDFVRGQCVSKEGRFDTEVLASALTLPEHRGQRYMSRLLEVGFSRAPACMFLYSDIGPAYYANFGFQEDPVWTEVIRPVVYSAATGAAAREISKWKPSSAVEVVAALERARTARVAVGEGRVAFLPDLEWVRWVELKYSFYAGLVGRAPQTADPLFFYGLPSSMEDSGPLALAWDAVAQRVDVLWGDPSRVMEWMPTVVAFAARFGGKVVRYWGNQAEANGKKTYPMFHPAPAIDAATGWRRLRRPVQLDLALGDWW